MSGPSKSYWRKSTAPTPIKKTATGAGGAPVEYLEWDLYEHNHTPNSYVMNSAGVCTSNPGMDAEYFSQGPERGDGGKQTWLVGDSKQAKIVPRSYEFTVGYDPDHTGVVKMNLIGNITSSFNRFEMLYDTGYTGAGVVGAWTILKYDASIVFVSKNESDGGTTVQEMINAPIYVVELTPSHPLSEAVLYTDERPIQIENISVQDLSWAVNIVIPKQSMGIPSATYY